MRVQIQVEKDIYDQLYGAWLSYLQRYLGS